MSHWPRTGASIIALKGKKVLLIQRGKPPYENYWSLPGGSQEAGETLEACARRELAEETGLRVETVDFVGIRDRIASEEDGTLSHHFVLATYLGDVLTGEPVAGDDAKAVGWFLLDEMTKLQTTPDTVAFVRDALVRFGRLSDT